jgi:dipeptidyl-peptidase-4
MKRMSPSLLLRLIVLGLLLVAGAASAKERSKDFTVEEIFTGSKFSTRSVRAQWYEGGRSYTTIETDSTTKIASIWKTDVSSGTKMKLIEGALLVTEKGGAPLAIENYIASPDGRAFLFTGKLPARSLKTGGNFFLYDLDRKEFRQLTNTKAEQMNVKFSSDGRSIGFVRDNNIFTLQLAGGKEEQRTFDGAEHILNGHFDWVYEEEFGISDGWQFSPNGKYLAYWQVDERREPEFPIVNFIPINQEITRQRYPKPGDPNAIVKIGIVDLVSPKTVWADIGVPLDSTQDTYIPRMMWAPGSRALCVERLNRRQNRLDLMLVDAASGKGMAILTETSTTWIDITDDLTFLKKSDRFLWSSERDGYNHLYLYDTRGTLIRQLTHGEWDVDRLISVDEKSGCVYFSAGATSPMNREIYSVGFDGKGFKRITKEEGTSGATFSSDCSVFFHTWSDANTPTKTMLRRRDGSLIRVVEDGRIAALDEYRISPKTFFTFTTSDGVRLNGWMIKPPDFDPAKKYPVIMYVDGGPGSQTVLNAWGGQGFLWQEMLAEKGYVVASVDGRGTGARESEFKTVTYKHLGKWETHDQIEGVKYLVSLPFVDGSRIGIFGASYGGFLTLMCFLQGNDVFKAAIASSSVTNWEFYDSIYTERYMLTPAENPDGYKESAPVTYAKNLKGNLLIVHGTDDDNVHMMNSITMINELVKENKLFETSLYPGSKHGIQARVQYRETMTNFFLEKL